MSYLADVEMPSKNEEPELDKLEFREDVEVSEFQDEFDDEGVEEEPSPLPPPPQKKEKLKSEDIFKPKQAPPKKVKPEIEESKEEPIIPKITPVKEKKKRVLSEKQKEALAKGREKRSLNKAAKKQNTPAAPAPAPQVEKEENKVTPAPAPAPSGISDEKLQELIFQGVSKYDSMRKERKAKKRESQAQQTHDNKVFSDINSALNRTNDPWASAFNF